MSNAAASTKSHRSVADEEGLRALADAWAAFRTWQVSQGVRDEQEFGATVRKEVMRLGAAHEKLFEALRPFVGGDLGRPVMAPDAALIGASGAYLLLRFCEHERLVGELRDALVATSYIARAGKVMKGRAKKRANTANIAWVLHAADHWESVLGTPPSKSGTFARLLGIFSDQERRNGHIVPPLIGEAALDTALSVWLKYHPDRLRAGAASKV